MKPAVEHVRAFFAVPLSEPVRNAVAATARALETSVRGRAVRWARPEGYHLTLRFLGEIEATCTADLAASVRRRVAPLSPFALAFAEVELFPSRRRPRVIALRLEASAALEALAAQVEEAVREAGLPAEPRPFRAHLTLGRVRDRVVPELDAAAPAVPSQAVSEVVLFQSELGPSGARYVPLERIALEGSDHPAIRKPEGDLHGEERSHP